MGFDIECIIDIHTYPGEYFCPVCRTLVYPNEALQSQCTHLYCKPCLAHIANNTRACPYDGYLVTEADSKPLLETDKALAENIGKVKVRCLYHRSGCTWEGLLSECTSHCSGCAFGTSPVICNRCGIQIVHRQVHDHAQSCPGVYQVQQATDATHNTASSGTMGATAGLNQNQATVQSGAPASQAQNSQAAPAPMLPGQDSNQQTSGSSQAPAAVQAALPTPEQWYQQQYQQYYQHYAGYDLYQQAYQPYYPYQQPHVQQIQQHTAAHGGQPQLQVYSQAPVQAQSQSQVQPLQHSQSQPQQLVQSQAQAVQPQAGLPQAQAQAQAQAQQGPVAHVQSLNLQTQNHSLVTQQQQAQIPSQSSLPHGFPASQSQGHLMQPQAQPHIQVPQYQQHLQPSQVQLQPHLPTQTQLPAQPHSQLQQPQHLQHNTPHPQMRPSQPNQSTALNAQAQPMHSSANAVPGHQSYPPPQPLQQAQLGVPQQHPVHIHPTSGSLAPGQLHGQIPQQPPPVVPTSHGPILTQQASFPSQGPVPSMPAAQQQQFHPQAQHPSHSVQHRPPVHPTQQLLPQQYVQQQPLPGLVPGPLHQQGHFPTQQSVQSQLRPQGLPLMMQPNPQSHIHLQQNVAVVPGLQHQQTHNYVGRPVIPVHGAPGQPMPPFPQTSGGFGSVAQARPAQLGSNQPSLTRNYAHTANNQLQTSSDLQFVQSGMLQRQGDHVSIKPPVGHEAGLPSQDAVEKVVNAPRLDSDGLKSLKSEAGMAYKQELTGPSTDRSRQNEPLATDGASELREGKDLPGRPLSELIRMKEESTTYSLEPPANGKSVQSVNQKDTNGNAHDEELESHKSQKGLFQKSGDESLQSTHAVSSPPGSKPDSFKNVNSEGGQTSGNARDQLQLYNHEQHTHHYGTNQQKSAGPQILQSIPPCSEGLGHPPTQVKPQGLGVQPQPRIPMNPSEQLQPQLLKQPPDAPLGGVPVAGSMSSFGGGPGYFGAPHGPPFTAADPRDGIMGRAPQHGSEGHFVPPHLVNPVEAEMIQSQKPGRFDGRQSKLPVSSGRGPVGPPSGGEPSSFRMDGGPGLNASLRSQNEKFKPLSGDHLKPFSKDTPWPSDQDAGHMAFDRPPHGLNYDSGLKLGSVSGGPPPRVLHSVRPSGDMLFSDARERGKVEFDRTHPNVIGPRRDYLGHPPQGFGGPSSVPQCRDDIDGRGVRSFGEGSKSYDLPSGPLGNSFHENRFPPLPSFQRRGELDGPENLRFVEHVPPGPPQNHLRRGDLFGQDFPSGHFRRGELGPGNSPSHLRLGDPTSFGPFPGHGRVGELPGPGHLSHNLRFGESFVGNKPSLPRLGEPGFRSSFSQGFPNDGPYAGGMDPFDNSRKRKPVSMGWCRICQVDCETVEGLDMHSQSREHQKMAMDMVMNIKQRNRKRSRMSNDRAVREETNKMRNSGVEGRGNKP